MDPYLDSIKILHPMSLGQGNPANHKSGRILKRCAITSPWFMRLIWSSFSGHPWLPARVPVRLNQQKFHMRNSHNHPCRSTIKTSDITLKIAAMAHMQMAELWAFWDSHFASRPIHPNRKHLESRLAYRLQELTFGGGSVCHQDLAGRTR